MGNEFQRQAEISMSCRRAFRVDGGLLLGLGPADMDVGDQVWVLSGADTPAILRPSPSGCHRLMGEALVYGMMHGQAATQWTDLQVVVLE